MDTEKNNDITDRCISIERDYDSLVKPVLNVTSTEDLDDAYQERLEYNYYVSDLCDEYKELNAKLNYNNRRLYPKSLRRV